MIDGALYTLPTLEGKLSGIGPTLFIGDTSLTETEKELLKSLVYGPGDTLSIFNETVDITNSNESTSIEYGKPYSAILTCDPLKAISSAIYMGGKNISERKTVETYCKHVISIPEVTGIIRITGSTMTIIRNIQATYTQSKEIHTNTSLDELRDDLVVRGGLGGSSMPYVLTDYTLSGDLTVGTSTITVDFHGKTTTFDVVVT